MKTIADGVWPVMITPFTADNKIDYDAVLRVIEWYDKAGVAGIFAVCQSSEMFLLSREERIQLAKFVIEHTPRHMGVVVSGHVAETVEEQIREAQDMLDLGADSYVFISGKLAAPEEDDDVVRRQLAYLAERIDGNGFGIYECPLPYKRVLSPELMRWCAETGKFAFVKDTCGDLDLIRAKCEAVKGTPLKIYNANSATLLESLRMGCAGYSGVMANFHPDLYVWLCEHYKTEPEKAEQLLPFLGATSMVEWQGYPVNAKYHMQLTGVPMELVSRVRDASWMTPTRKLEIEQFYEMTQRFRNSFCK